jgi:hypothetical protein
MVCESEELGSTMAVGEIIQEWNPAAATLVDYLKEELP